MKLLKPNEFKRFPDGVYLILYDSFTLLWHVIVKKGSVVKPIDYVNTFNETIHEYSLKHIENAIVFEQFIIKDYYNSELEFRSDLNDLLDND